jgi:hypothetical protein
VCEVGEVVTQPLTEVVCIFFFSFVFALHTVTIKRVNICRKKALFIVFVLVVLRCKQILFARTGSEGFR